MWSDVLYVCGKVNWTTQNAEWCRRLDSDAVVADPISAQDTDQRALIGRVSSIGQQCAMYKIIWADEAIPHAPPSFVFHTVCTSLCLLIYSTL